MANAELTRLEQAIAIIEQTLNALQRAGRYGDLAYPHTVIHQNHPN